MAVTENRACIRRRGCKLRIVTNTMVTLIVGARRSCLPVARGAPGGARTPKSAKRHESCGGQASGQLCSHSQMWLIIIIMIIMMVISIPEDHGRCCRAGRGEDAGRGAGGGGRGGKPAVSAGRGLPEPPHRASTRGCKVSERALWFCSLAGPSLLNRSAGAGIGGLSWTAPGAPGYARAPLSSPAAGGGGEVEAAKKAAEAAAAPAAPVLTGPSARDASNTHTKGEQKDFLVGPAAFRRGIGDGRQAVTITQLALTGLRDFESQQLHS